ncbi:MerR family transcriptional regulator [Saccharopolyspora sp. NPDC000359]|uniref:MerR family transcriptional regulator n=1 Tax=Saccharopolyspora sp. NPDC000359 TaxID=3154251 RepID=UPI003320E335
MATPKVKLRPVDLARAAGISTQQVRNYLDAGVLPPARRTESGYRCFHDRHLRALLTYRALVRGFGIHTAQAIMHAVHAGAVPKALELVDAGHAALHEQRRSLDEIGAALEAVADQAPAPKADMRIGDLAAHLGVRTSALRVWESEGLLVPERERGTGYRCYRPPDIRDAQVVHMLRQARYPLPQVRQVLTELRRTGSREALRAALAQRRADLTTRARAMLEAASHLHASPPRNPNPPTPHDLRTRTTPVEPDVRLHWRPPPTRPVPRHFAQGGGTSLRARGVVQWGPGEPQFQLKL